MNFFKSTHNYIHISYTMVIVITIFVCVFFIPFISLGTTENGIYSSNSNNSNLSPRFKFY